MRPVEHVRNQEEARTKEGRRTEGMKKKKNGSILMRTFFHCDYGCKERQNEEEEEDHLLLMVQSPFGREEGGSPFPEKRCKKEEKKISGTLLMLCNVRSKLETTTADFCLLC